MHVETFIYSSFAVFVFLKGGHLWAAAYPISNQLHFALFYQITC